MTMTYAAGCNGKTVELQADTLWDAKQQAVALLKPTKKDAGLLWVLPVQKIETQGVTAFVIDPGLMN